MELTDSGPIIIFAVLAVLLFALLVLGWPRWGGRVARGVARGVQVLLLNTVVVALCFVLLNDHYVFYSSWGDLFGARSGQVVAHHGGTTGQLLQAKVKSPGISAVTSARNYRLPQPGARLQTYSVADPSSGTATRMLVYLPAGYNPGSSRTYPVILGLHGFPGSPVSFSHQNFFTTADQLTAQHLLAASIFVIPTIDDPPSIDTECINGPAGAPQTETWLSRTVPEWVVRHLHARTNRLSWATMGYSYGAWCAAMLTMRHPAVFGGAIVLQGYFRPDFRSAYDPYTPRELQPYDLIGLARTSPPPVAMWVLASRQDNLSYPTTARFLSVARAPLDISSTVLATGGHRAAVYEPYSAAALMWLARTLPPFHA
jgi:hypothetical protein